MCEQVYTLKTSLRDLVLLKKKKLKELSTRAGQQRELAAWEGTGVRRERP